MRSIWAIARRILSQFAHDKRTVALMLIAPVVVLWLLSALLDAGATVPRIATVDLPESFQSALETKDAHISNVSADEAEQLLRANEVSAVLSMDGDGKTLILQAEGSDASKTAAVAGVTAAALADAQRLAVDQMKADAQVKKEQAEQALESQQERIGEAIKSIMLVVPEAARDHLPPELQNLVSGTGGAALSPGDISIDISDYLPIQNTQTTYLHGNDTWATLDYFGPVLIGIFLLVFVFITSSMSLINEKSAGTMARFLATPIRPMRLVGGYTLGFGVLALIQATVITSAALFLIGLPCEGSVALVLVTAVLFALVSVTLGLLVSGLAASPFQVIQLMLLLVWPQVLLSGLFDLSGAPGWMQVLSACTPASYGVSALRDVMLRGAGFSDVGMSLAAMVGFIVLFYVLAACRFRKKHARRSISRCKDAA